MSYIIGNMSYIINKKHMRKKYEKIDEKYLEAGNSKHTDSIYAVE